jgi:pimeloyl-ACP methyl ester carboxylesterase
MIVRFAAQQLCALHNGSRTMKQRSEPTNVSFGAGTTPRQTALKERGKWFAAASVVAALAGAALFNSAKARRAEANSPPAGKFIEVDGVRLHYVDGGAGSSTVVLLHGNGVMLQDYVASGVLDEASREHRVIAFDRPGFGYSERPRATMWTPTNQAKLILRALQKLGIEQAVLVGHSWGTMVAIAMALEKPGLVKGLLLLSGYYYGTMRPDVLPTSVPAIPLVGDLIAHTVSPLAGTLMSPAAIKASFSPASVHEKFAQFPLDMTLRPSQIRATAADTAMMVPAAVELSQHYDKLAIPVIAMVGEGDLIAHVDKHSRRLVEHLADGELRIVPCQGHLFHYAVPKEVVDAISQLAH